MSKRIATPTIVVAVLTLSAGAALAAWTAGSSGTGSSRARSLGAGNTVTASASNSTVTFGFTETSVGTAKLSTLTGGGYTIKRYGSSTVTVSATCTADVPGTGRSCTETNVPIGSWTYKVTPTLSGWTGTESSTSAETRVMVML